MNHSELERLVEHNPRAGKQYVVSRRIATGGMAEVLLAARTGGGGFEKLVVLKRILPHLREDGHFLQMFLNEARLASLLKHPNIVEIYDVERSGDDFVVVMEYLSGEDLRYVIGHLRQERKPMDVAVASRMMADAAAALHFAHTAEDMDGRPMGVVHRDVAPGNILVTYDGITKLLDFGIAKATTRATYTAPGTMKGKFAYMSPEHVQHQPLDNRSDIFSLGVVFWEVLTAQRLFRGANDAAVLREVMDREIPPPSSVNPDLPADLDEIVMTCLQRDIKDRFVSAKLVRERLEQLLVKLDRYVTPTQVGDWMRTALPWRHHQRREMEHTVAKEAREGPSTSAPPATLPASGFFGTGSSTLPALSGAPGSFSSSYPSSTGHSALHSSGASRISVMHTATGTRAQPWSAVSVLIVSAIATLLLILLVAGVFWLGQALRPQKAALVVHVVPEGSTLTINGTVRARSVGAAGTAIPVPTNRRLHVVVSKAGRLARKRAVTSPASGTRHLYFTLPQAP